MPARLDPSSIGDIFDAAFRIYRRHFRALMAITMLSAVPTEILRYIILRNISFISFGSFGPVAIFGLYLTVFIVDTLLALILGSVMNGALAKYVSSAYLGEATTLLNSYRMGIGRYLILIIASAILFAIKNGTRPLGLFLDSIWYGGGILFISGRLPYQSSWYSVIPFLLVGLSIIVALRLVVLLLYASYFLVPQVVVLENNGLFNSLRRSRQLVRGSMRRALAIVIPAEILRLLFNGAQLALLQTLQGYVIDLNNQDVVISVIKIAIQMLSQPILITIFTVFYYDLRVRNESFDLELLVRQNVSA